VRLCHLAQQLREGKLVGVGGVQLIAQEATRCRSSAARSSATAAGSTSPPIRIPLTIAPITPPT
jgi:hypothetical protein